MAGGGWGDGREEGSVWMWVCLERMELVEVADLMMMICRWDVVSMLRSGRFGGCERGRWWWW